MTDMQHQHHHLVFLRQILSLSFGLAGFVCAALPARADDARTHDNYEGERSSRRDSSGMGKTHIALDFDFDSALSAPETTRGGGGALRIGQKLDLILVSLTPEIGGGYHAFGGNDQTKVYTGFLGGRFGVGKIIEPSIFGHVGFGRVEGLETRTAPMLDGGLALDFTLLPLIDIGVHGGYNVMFPRDDGSALKFFTLGAQAALVL